MDAYDSLSMTKAFEVLNARVEFEKTMFKCKHNKCKDNKWNTKPKKPQAFLVRFPSNLSWPADAGQNSTEAANLDNDVNDNTDDHPNWPARIHRDRWLFAYRIATIQLNSIILPLN